MSNSKAVLTDKKARKVSVAAFVGTALESYDQYVYLWLAGLLVGTLFFPTLGPLWGTAAGFLTIGFAFFVRVPGAVIFGHLGDRIGRKKTLILTITLMGIATGGIGLLPTYEQAGWLGAIFLVLLRLGQGLSLGGEWGGAVTLAAEHSPPKRRAFYISLVQLGSPVGTILSGTIWLLIINYVGFENLADSWLWRIPLLLAFPLMLIAIYLRMSIDESPSFQKIADSKKQHRFPISSLFKTWKTFGILMVGTGAALLGHGSYQLMNGYTREYGVFVLGYSAPAFEWAIIVGSGVQLVTIPLFGWLATKYSSNTIVALGALGTAIAAFPMYFLIIGGSQFTLVMIMIVGGILPTAAWAALGGVMSDLFDDRNRYTGVAMAYNLAAGFASLLPATLLAMRVLTDGAWWHPGVVLAALSAITLLSALQASRMRVSDREPRYARTGS